jgi:hypothetical protein
MKAANATVAAISHGFDLGFQRVLFPTSAIIRFLPVGFGSFENDHADTTPLIQTGNWSSRAFRINWDQ